MTIKEFADISSVMIRVLSEALEGISKEDALAIAQDGGRKLNKAFWTVINEEPSLDVFLCDRGLKIEEDFEEDDRLPAERLVLVNCLEADKQYISGKEIVECARKRGANCGLRQALRFFKNPERIPVSWEGNCQVFAGTVMRNIDGNLFVLGLYHVARASRWFLQYVWLDRREIYGSNIRLVCPRE